MNKICTVCGHAGENVWRDGKYYCASCGAEIDVTQPDPTPVTVNVPCPVCQNASGNTAENGRCRCALCGTTFIPQINEGRNSGYTNNNTGYSGYNNGGYNSNKGYSRDYGRKAELEKEKSKRLMWGVIFLFLFWPVAVYHFYKLYEISNELAEYD